MRRRTSDANFDLRFACSDGPISSSHPRDGLCFLHRQTTEEIVCAEAGRNADVIGLSILSVSGVRPAPDDALDAAGFIDVLLLETDHQDDHRQT